MLHSRPRVHIYTQGGSQLKLVRLYFSIYSYLVSSWKACPSVQFSWNWAPTRWVTNCPNLSLFCIHLCRASFFSMVDFSISNFLTTSIHLFMCDFCCSMVFCWAEICNLSSSFACKHDSALFHTSEFRTIFNVKLWKTESLEHLLWSNLRSYYLSFESDFRLRYPSRILVIADD